MEVIQQIGAYAAFAAVLGLAVLSALYFSQARDLRRLREQVGEGASRPGAGRSPEGDRRTAAARPAAPASVQRTVTEAPAGGTEPAGSPGGHNGPAEVSPVPAATQVATRPPATRPPAPPIGAAARARAGMGGGVAAQGVGAYGRGTEAPEGERGGLRSSLPYILLTVVGILIVIGAGAFAIGMLGGRENPASGGAATTSGGGPGARPNGNEPPGAVTFSVLNGTGVDGLAKQVADRLEADGYRRGNVTNAEARSTESSVLYAQGARAEATAVARRLHIARTQPVDARSQALAGDASVIVVVGADRAR